MVHLIRSKKHPGAVFLATGKRKALTFIAKVYSGDDAEALARIFRDALCGTRFDSGVPMPEGSNPRDDYHAAVRAKRRAAFPLLDAEGNVVEEGTPVDFDPGDRDEQAGPDVGDGWNP